MKHLFVTGKCFSNKHLKEKCFLDKYYQTNKDSQCFNFKDRISKCFNFKDRISKCKYNVRTLSSNSVADEISMHMNREGFESGDPESDPKRSQVVSQLDSKPKEGVGDQAADLLPDVRHGSV